MSLLNQFSSYSLNSDGIIDIEFLKPMSFEPQTGNVPRTEKLVVVLVEDRLFKALPSGGPSVSELTSRLIRYKEDLLADGFSSWFIQAKVYDGPNHQDGRTLLAIREFFKAVKTVNNKFMGSLLIGSFPEATLVRRWLWKRQENVTINNTLYNNTTYLRIVPEMIAGRSEIVLSDLNGNWRNVYVQSPTKLESIKAIPENGFPAGWEQGMVGFTSKIFSVEEEQFEDFFWINDSNYSKLTSPAGKLNLSITSLLRSPELVASQRRGVNPIAIPSIFVSRINARSIAIGPDPNYRDRNGRGFLDANGRPQVIHAEAILDRNLFKRRDPALERRLLISYFDRNHLFRNGENSKKQRTTATIAFPQSDFSANSANNYLKRTNSSFTSSVIQENGTLLDYVNWLKKTASLRGIVAHSSRWNTAFGRNYLASNLERVTGRPWRWKKRDGSLHYTPSFDEQGPAADLYLHRTLWENKVLSQTGGDLLVHQGCEVNTPSGVNKLPYNNATYGDFQNGEGILFYLNSLAILTRAKVYNDAPQGLKDAFDAKTEDDHFGAAWKAYFNNDTRSSSLTSPSSKKRAYFWSILGDWTLRLFYKRQDCVGINPSQLRVEKVNNSWKVTDGRSWIKSVPTRAEAEKMLGVMKYYGLTQQCFVGRPNPPLEYYLVNGKAPAGSMRGEDCLLINPMACEVRRISNRWIIVEGNHYIISFTDYEEARMSLSIMRRHQIKYICYVNRPGAIMTYFRR